MVSKNTEKLFRKLQSKKHRWQNEMFIAEGPKVVQELLDMNLEAIHLFSDIEKWKDKGAIIINTIDLKKISSLETSNEIVGIFKFPKEINNVNSKLVLLLDQINDPGNLGTIIRTADWFGINRIYCTTGTTDIYNAKCIQSTMGSIGRVKVSYHDSEELLNILDSKKILVADMSGTNVFEYSNPMEDKVIVMGSESHGPSDFWKENGEKITIPKNENSQVESLNVAQAAGIIISQLSH